MLRIATGFGFMVVWFLGILGITFGAVLLICGGGIGFLLFENVSNVVANNSLDFFTGLWAVLTVTFGGLGIYLLSISISAMRSASKGFAAE